MRIVIITGASSGMGREFALQLDKKLHSIDEYWLVGRNEEELAKTKRKCIQKQEILLLILIPERHCFHLYRK